MKKKLLSLFLVGVLSIGLISCTNKSNAGSAQTGKQNKAVEIYLVRHGKTMLNTTDRVQGWADAPLTASGVEVAEYLGEGLKLEGVQFDAAYSSDSGRSVETAKIVLTKSGQENLVINENADLREVCFGDYEGELNPVFWNDIAVYNNTTMEEFMGNLDLELFVNTNAKLDETKGKIAEDWNTVSSRMKQGIDTIAQETEKNGGGKVMVVSHGMSLLTFLKTIAPEEFKDFKGNLSNASVTKIVYEDGKYTVETINDMSYVEKGKANK